MIAFDLRCPGEHVFEAWFASSAAFEDQRSRALIACPVCGGTGVVKAVMAPNIPAKGGGGPSPERAKTMLAAIAAAQAKALESSRWVGSRFAEEARAIHVGDCPHETIHGRATAAEAKALVEEGVSVAPLPLPVVPPEQSH